MISLKLFLTIYLFGGVTFLPLVIFAGFYAHRRFKVFDTSDSDPDDKDDDRIIDPDFKAAEFEENKGVNVLRQGWISVTTRYYYFHTEIPTATGSDGSSETVQIPERSQLKRKHRFYAVIKHGNLFLYRDNSPKSNLVHAISLQDSFVTLWPRHPNEELSDSSLFTKRTCISVLRKGSTFVVDGKLQFLPNEAVDDDAPAANQFFLYFENNMEKEDWYFDLINVSKTDLNKTTEIHGVIDANFSARAAHLKTADMLYLIQTINSTEGQLTTKWINALLGRIFLSLQRTETLKRYLHKKLYQKLAKIKRPDFLDDFVVKEVEVGNSAPMITNPKLVELSLEGLTKIKFDFMYKGNVAVNVSTKATINLGSRFKQREVPLQLSLKLRELSGPVIVHMKPPPSNRIWYTFETEPIFDVEVEPVVSSSKLSYNMITNAIKSKFAEAIKESLVAPNWDDVVYYNTESEIYRGGIWENHEDTTGVNMNPASGNPKAKNRDKNLSKTGKKILQEDKPDILNPDLAKQGKKVNEFVLHEDQPIKRLSSPKMENFKSILKTRSREECNDANSESKSHSSFPIGDEEDSEDSLGSKKIFKNSLKKIGKWYKETVTTVEGLENEATVEIESNPKASSTSYAPEMISNRRKSLPRKPRPSNIATNYHPTDDAHLSPTSPTLNATEMFVNKDKNRSRSSSSNDTGAVPYLPANYSAMQKRAFVKEKHDQSFPEEFRDSRTDRTQELARNPVEENK